MISPRRPHGELDVAQNPRRRDGHRRAHGDRHDRGRHSTLTERELLSLVAEGLTNIAIARRLVLTERTVEGHVRSVLMKLDLTESQDAHRRVLAVIAYLRAADHRGCPVPKTSTGTHPGQVVAAM